MLRKITGSFKFLRQPGPKDCSSSHLKKKKVNQRKRRKSRSDECWKQILIEILSFLFISTFVKILIRNDHPTFIKVI